MHFEVGIRSRDEPQKRVDQLHAPIGWLQVGPQRRAVVPHSLTPNANNEPRGKMRPTKSARVSPRRLHCFVRCLQGSSNATHRASSELHRAEPEWISRHQTTGAMLATRL